MGIESGAPGCCLGFDDFLGVGQEVIPGCGCRIGNASLAGDARMPAAADHIEQKWPAIDFSVNGAFLADRRNDVVKHIFRNVFVPWLDDTSLDHRRHFHERRLADINVPTALALLGLGHEALDAKAFNGCYLVVDTRKPFVHRRDAGMKILNPLIEGGGERAVLGKGRADAVLGNGSNTGETKSCHHAAGEEFTPVDLAALQLLQCGLLQDEFLFFTDCHRFLSLD